MSNEIDIIMATHNHLELTIAAVNALYANTHSPFTLCVVDDSTDRLTPLYFNEIMKEYKNIKYIHSDTPYVHGNQIVNIGLKNTTTPIVAYLGNSTRVEPDWLDIAQQIMEQDASVGIIGFKLLFNNGIIEHAGMYWTPEMPHHMNYGANFPGHRYSEVREVEMVGFALVLLRRTVFPEGLDEITYYGFRGYDDCDSCMDARKRGWKVLYCGLGAAYHQAGATRYNVDDRYFTEAETNRQTFLNRWGGTDEAKKSVVMGKIYV